MANCAGCKQDSRTRLDANNLRKKCADAAKAAEKELIGVDPDKAVADLTARELVEIIKKVSEPIENRVTKIDETVQPLVKQVEILEKDLRDKSEKIDTLTSIIINMQKSLNMIDMAERATNVMISGLDEANIVVSDDLILATDKKKVEHVLDKIGTNIPNGDIQECTRVERPKEGYTRLLKLRIRTKEQRNLITDKAANLKAIPYLKKTYIKKDTHPVYVQETSRLTAKMKRLKEIPGNEDKVKIVDGNLEVDGKIVDKNTFSV